MTFHRSAATATPTISPSTTPRSKPSGPPRRSTVSGRPARLPAAEARLPDHLKTPAKNCSSHLPWFGKNPHKFGHNEDIDLVDIASAEFPTDAVVNYRSALRQKTEALDLPRQPGRWQYAQRRDGLG